MDKNEREEMEFEPNFNINNVSFQTVNKEFENRFREIYKNSLEMMSDSENRLTNASAANTLGVLGKMSRRISDYNKQTFFGTQTLVLSSLIQ